MKLRGIDFGPVCGASGVTNFFNQGWPQHKLFKIFPGFDFSGMTFTAKTMTLDKRPGNMPLSGDLQPSELMPKSIYVNLQMFLNGHVLNAVGLSGPGSESLFNDGRWQNFTKPFFLSFMPVSGNEQSRLEEARKFVELAKKYLPKFKAPVALQVNFSCPNVEHEIKNFEREVGETLEILSDLNIPLVPKFSITLNPEVAMRICSKDWCDGICISNTIPWGEILNKVDWQRITGHKDSPLQQFGGGGLSGKTLLPLVVDWVKEIRSLGFTKPINAGGGILKIKDVDKLFDAGANSIFVGSVAIIRPWRVKAIINRANKLAINTE